MTKKLKLVEISSGRELKVGSSVWTNTGFPCNIVEIVPPDLMRDCGDRIGQDGSSVKVQLTGANHIPISEGLITYFPSAIGAGWVEENDK